MDWCPLRSAIVRCQRLLNLAREQGVAYDALLIRFVLERALWRLSQSPHATDFILKALLFQCWQSEARRATLDIDLLGRGADDVARLARVFEEVLTHPVAADGVEFDVARLVAAPIHGGQEHGGVRVTCPANTGTARLRAQIDIGFGDAVTPRSEVVVLPVLLDLPAPSLAAYPRETVVAEKLEAIVRLGQANSRLKDYADLWLLAREGRVDHEAAAAAVRATFERRRTELPAGLPLGLGREFVLEPEKGRSGEHHESGFGLDGAPAELVALVEEVTAFIGPVLARARMDGRSSGAGSKGWPWRGAAARSAIEWRAARPPRFGRTGLRAGPMLPSALQGRPPHEHSPRGGSARLGARPARPPCSPGGA